MASVVVKSVKWYPSRLRQMRLHRGFTCACVAEELGFSRVSYSRYETGSRVPDIETLARLCAYFNCTADYLLGLSSAFDRTWQDDAKIEDGGVV